MSRHDKFWDRKNQINNWNFLSTFRCWFLYVCDFIDFVANSLHTLDRNLYILYWPVWRFHFWISVTVTTLKKVASIIYMNDNCFRRVEVFANVCESQRDEENVSSRIVYFSVVIIVSINSYWQLGEFVNFLLALSSVLKDKPEIRIWRWEKKRERKVEI